MIPLAEKVSPVERVARESAWLPNRLAPGQKRPFLRLLVATRPGGDHRTDFDEEVPSSVPHPQSMDDL